MDKEKILGKIEVVAGWVIGILFLIVAIIERNLVIGGLAIFSAMILIGVGQGHLESKKNESPI